MYMSVCVCDNMCDVYFVCVYLCICMCASVRACVCDAHLAWVCICVSVCLLYLFINNIFLIRFIILYMDYNEELYKFILLTDCRT